MRASIDTLLAVARHGSRDAQVQKGREIEREERGIGERERDRETEREREERERERGVACMRP